MDREEMILSNLNLVHQVLKKIYRPPYAYYSYEDMYQEGVVALIRAVDKYNPDLGFSFSTYAFPFIRGSVLRFVNENHNLKYSRSQFTAIYRRSKEDVDPNEVLKIAVATESDRQILEAMKSVSLNSEVIGKDGSATEIGDLIPDPDAEKAFDFTNIDDELESIKDKLLVYKRDSYREVVEEWYYSVIFGYRVSQSEISKKTGVSQPAVSRYLKQFKQAFYKALQENGFEIRIESYE